MQFIRVSAVLGIFALSLVSAWAAPNATREAREAAYLQEEFGHDLCTRNDRELRKLNKALGKRAASPISTAIRAK